MDIPDAKLPHIFPQPESPKDEPKLLANWKPEILERARFRTRIATDLAALLITATRDVDYDILCDYNKMNILAHLVLHTASQSYELEHGYALLEYFIQKLGGQLRDVKIVMQRTTPPPSSQSDMIKKLYGELDE